MMIFFSALRRLFVFLVIFFAMHVVSGTVAQEPGTATKDATAISGGTLTGKVSYVGAPVAPRMSTSASMQGASLPKSMLARMADWPMW
jgi:hypothetical protein